MDEKSIANGYPQPSAVRILRYTPSLNTLTQQRENTPTA